jgi:hypothetical protein
VAYVIDDYRIGKQTRKGRPTPTEPVRVTVVGRDEADDFLGTRSPAERRDHLRRVRNLGLLVHDRGRLTRRVRTGGTRDGRPTTERCYVFRCGPGQVPRLRERRARVLTW